MVELGYVACNRNEEELHKGQKRALKVSEEPLRKG
jgi:hypothetical protein